MNISNVSSNGFFQNQKLFQNTYVKNNHKNDDKNNAKSSVQLDNTSEVIKGLQKREMEIKKEMQEVKDRKISQDAKDELLKSLNEQITQVESQIQSIEMEKAQQKEEEQEKKAEENKKKVNNADSLNNSQSSADMVQMSVACNDIRKYSGIKKGLRQKAKALKIEADLDQDRDHHGNAKDIVAAKRAKAGSLEVQADKIDRNIGKKFKEIDDKLSVERKGQSEEADLYSDNKKVKGIDIKI